MEIPVQIDHNTKIINKNYRYLSKNSIFQNPRIETTLKQIYNRSKTLHVYTNKTKDNTQSNIAEQKQSFRSFVKTRRNYKINKQRSMYINFKQEMIKLFQYLQKSQIDSDLLLKTKQNIMIGFLNDFIQRLSQRNLDEAEILVLVCNNLFCIIQKAVQKICLISKINQEVNLVEQIDMHQKYQKIFQKFNKQKQQMKQESQKKQKFTKILVSKLRQYKKSLKKLQQTLRIASDKLNQFRNDYFQVQIECINLTMQLKNIGPQSAKQMLNKKMALNMEKSKEYKILPSKKKVTKQANQFIKHRHDLENEKIKQQFFQAFNCNLKQMPEALNVMRAIQAILDNDQSLPVDYQIFNKNLIQKYQGDSKVDKQTDMQGFQIQKMDRKIGINANQRFFYQMTKMKGVQTQVIEKPLPVKTESIGIQCQFQYLKLNKCSQNKTYDLSFLFQNTIKSSNIRREQNNMKSSIILKNLQNFQNQRHRMKLHPRNFTPEHTQSNRDQNQNGMQSGSDEDKNTIYSKISEQVQPQKKFHQDLKPIQIKRKLRKIATTWTNKASFLNNFTNEIQKKQKNNQSLNLIEYSMVKQPSYQTIKDQLISISEAEQRLPKIRIAQSMKKLKTDEKSNMVQQKEKKTSQNKKYTKTSFFKGEHYKKTSNGSRKQNQRLNKPSPGKRINKTPSKQQNQIPPQLQIQQQKIPSVHIFPSKINIQVNQTQLFKQIRQEIQKTKSYPIQTSKKPSRIKNLCKTIDAVFQMVCKQYQCNNTCKDLIYYIYQTINNSFWVAKIKYVHKKVLTFIRQIYQLRQSNVQIMLFILMLGLNQQGQQNTQHSNLNNQLLIRIAKKISKNWKYPLKLSQLVINSQNIQENIEKQLQQSGFCYNFNYQLINNLHQLRLFNYKGVQLCPVLNWISKFIVQKQNIVVISYEPIIDLISQPGKETISVQFIQFLIALHFHNSYENKRIVKKLTDFINASPNQKQISKNMFAYFCCQVGILDFSRLFHHGLSIFKLKQNNQVLQALSVEMLKQKNLQNFPKDIIDKIFENCTQINNKNHLFNATIKKHLLILLYLKVQDNYSQNMLYSLIGQNIKNLYNITLQYLI